MGDVAEGKTVELAIPLAGSAPSERAQVSLAFCRIATLIVQPISVNS